jgi:hypothetical protein
LNIKFQEIEGKVVIMLFNVTEARIKAFEEMMGKHLSAAFIDWLKENGFFTAPASRNHHGNYEGGLFDHSYAVAEQLKQLTKVNRLKWEHPRSPLVVGMFHDLCKIDTYTIAVDNPGVEMFGSEVKGRTYVIEYNDDDLLLDGHGDKSVMYLAQHMKLTPEEVMCIRWHMGAFDEKHNWKYYTAAVKKYPNVLWTHTADMIASQIMGV